ncbi:spermidine synthase [Acetatifactor aquisgranensis]|uniref:spermidine synthase n=1 Tax=Acetatifactor aquisgranensis TaxID=2941233 RepID=UPI00203E02DF|nr:fused MFS/spermidine synthase [Acetatifactor aquisgranensis]
MSMTNAPKILKNKIFLYLTEFFAGMSVMAVELGASRLLAPYFSSSQIVWTIIIGTIMIAMALGNIYGGRSADKNPDPGRLYGRILIAAVWIAAIPAVGKYIILGISALLIFSVSSNFLIIAAFAACMVIFVFPLFLLGTVTPSLAKYSVGNLEESGKTVGNLGAFNTIGSIIGTFVPTFVTIPSVGTSVTFLIFSGILLVLAVLYFISAGRGTASGNAVAGKRENTRQGMHKEDAAEQQTETKCAEGAKKQIIEGKETADSAERMAGSGEDGAEESAGKDGKKKHAGSGTRKVIITLVCYAVCCVLGYSDSFAFWETNLTYEGESVYNYLQVKESDRSVILSTNVLFGVQSIYMKEQGMTGMYYDYAMAAPLMIQEKAPEDCKVLILGMGTGTYATQCRKYYGGMDIEGVEIDEKITALAREYFHLPEDVPVTTYDGRAFLNAVDEKYDVIMVDAYQDITIPFQMSSVEFFTLVKAHLAENGVMVVNMNMRGREEGNINQYLADTISSVFGQVYTVDVAGSTNRELFASDNGAMLANLEANRELLQDGNLYAMMERASAGLERYVPGEYILTDDKAPVELLGMQVIDDLIGDEVAYYKRIYEEEGIEGLLRSF